MGYISTTKKFKLKPTTYYAMSIAASWAGVGSFMNLVTMTRSYGILPALIWAFANSAACVLFGAVSCHLGTFRELMRSKCMQYIIGIMSVFQLWINMNGIREIWGDTGIGTTGGTVIVYAVCIIFIVLLLRFGMIRNVLTDSLSWVMVYILIFCVIGAAFLMNGATLAGIGIGLDAPEMKTGLWKGFLLLPGPFTYPYFYALLDYNDSNHDGTEKCNIRQSFAMGGVMFGIYMIFAFMAAFTTFGPVLSVVKAVLISIVGISSISTFIYSEYIVFGNRIGLAIDALAVLFWPLLISLGVMGVWTLMAEIRIYLIAVLLILAVIKKAVESKGVGKCR